MVKKGNMKNNVQERVVLKDAVVSHSGGLSSEVPLLTKKLAKQLTKTFSCRCQSLRVCLSSNPSTFRSVRSRTRKGTPTVSPPWTQHQDRQRRRTTTAMLLRSADDNSKERRTWTWNSYSRRLAPGGATRSCNCRCRFSAASLLRCPL